MVFGALVFAAGCLFGAILVCTGEKLENERRK